MGEGGTHTWITVQPTAANAAARIAREVQPTPVKAQMGETKVVAVHYVGDHERCGSQLTNCRIGTLGNRRKQERNHGGGELVQDVSGHRGHDDDETRILCPFIRAANVPCDGMALGVCHLSRATGRSGGTLHPERP